MQLADMAASQATASITYGDAVVYFTYNPNNYTAQVEAELQKLYGLGLAGDIAVAFVQKLVLKWDLMGDVVFDQDEAGIDILDSGRIINSPNPFPIINTVKMRFVPSALMGAINDKIQSEMLLEKVRRQASDVGSATAELRMLQARISGGLIAPGGTPG